MKLWTVHHKNVAGRTMIISKKVVATLATLTLGLGSLSACSFFEKPEKDEVKAGLKETVSHAVDEYAYGYGDVWDELLEYLSVDMEGIDKVIDEKVDCVVNKTYDDLSALALNRIASGTDGEIIFTNDNDMEVYKQAVEECEAGQIFENVVQQIEG